MTPWFIATQPFTPVDGDRWADYIEWSGLTQPQEVVSRDKMLWPTLLPETKSAYWPHTVQENSMLSYFLDFDYLRS